MYIGLTPKSDFFISSIYVHRVPSLSVIKGYQIFAPFAIRRINEAEHVKLCNKEKLEGGRNLHLKKRESAGYNLTVRAYKNSRCFKRAEKTVNGAYRY